MANTLTYASTTVQLPDDLLWPDEFDWRPVDQQTSYTIFGALRVESAEKLAGRPITLAGGDQYAWITRTTLLTLQDWAKLAGQQFTLVYRGESFTVVFDQANTAITARQVLDVSDPVGADPYVVTLRFLEV